MEIRSEMIQVAASGGSMPAQLARPAAAGPFPGVIVVQEAFGLNGHIKAVAGRLAAEGYVTLAPDLFYRGGAGRTASYAELPKAIEMMTALKDDEIVEDVAAAVRHLERDATVRPDRLGITGFC